VEEGRNKETENDRTRNRMEKGIKDGEIEKRSEWEKAKKKK